MILIWIYTFLVGLIFGSAASALIYRIPKRVSWVQGRSMCPGCKHTLGWRDLIPVWSYIFSGGKCRYCKKRTSVGYPLLELGCGVGFLFIGWYFGLGVYSVLLMAIFWVSLIISMIDMQTQTISDATVIMFGLLAIALAIVRGGAVENLIFSVAFGVIVIGGIWWLSRQRAMGSGDVLLIAPMGVWLGWPKIAIALWAAFIIGGTFGMFKMMLSKANLKTEIAFGPFLLLGAWIAFLAGDTIWRYVFGI